MLARWIRRVLWGPFELQCRRFPLWPFRAIVTEPVDGVQCIRIGNVLTRTLSELGGGYEYAVSYLVDRTLLIDTGFPWARRCLKATLIRLGAARTIECVVNTTALLQRKLAFLLAVQQRALEAASTAKTLGGVTRRAFERADPLRH